jgi:acyl-CoA thioester hydrolase
MFQKSFIAGVADFDFDERFRGAACLDRARDVRLMFFAEHGFAPDVFRKQRLSPLLLKERLDYTRDIGVLEEFKVSLSLAGLAPDGSRYTLRCEFVRADGKVAARVSSTGGWLDANLQKLTADERRLPAPAQRPQIAPARPAAGKATALLHAKWRGPKFLASGRARERRVGKRCPASALPGSARPPEQPTFGQKKSSLAPLIRFFLVAKVSLTAERLPLRS